MQNDNPLLTKLLTKVDFELIKKFKVADIKELNFIPINIQPSALFVTICPKTDKEVIEGIIKDVVDKKIEYIFLSSQRFETFFQLFESKLKLEEYVETTPEIPKEPVAIKKNVADGEEHDPMDLFSEEDIEEDEIEYTEAPETNMDVDEIFVEKVDINEQINSNNQVDETEQSDNGEHIDENEQPESESQVEVVEDQEPPHEEPRKSSRIKMVESPTTKRIGEILIEEGLINNKQLDIALAESRMQEIPLGSVLVKLGYVSMQDLKEALGAQQGVEFATEEQLKVLPNAVSVLPEDFVKLNKVIPLSATNDTLVVGMVNPGDTRTINEIVYQTGLKPNVMMITHYEYENFIKTYYESSERKASQIIKEVENADDADDIEANEDSLWEQVEKEIQDATGSVSKFAYSIITLGIDQKASDIHIEPRLDGYVVRYRVDGILREIFKIPQKIESQVISRFKVLARMNIAEHRRTQDGNFTIAYKDLKYDFRINTLPVAGKEKMVIRILAPAMTIAERKTEITLQGAQKEDIEKVKTMISTPNGIILTSGPTGSGKTTTLYSLISYLNSPEVNITTIEDPVEIKLDGVNQSAVNPKAGVTFATSLRAILRQDPDIILVGEIRDFETLEVAISASLTGHLVLSTIHTNSAAATITRLIEMGAKDYLISSTLTGVLAQRLVRKLCPHCRVAYKPTIEEAKKVYTDPLDVANFTKQTVYKKKGCSMCNNTGYAGRVGIYEILPVNKEVKKLIAQRAHDVVIEDYAVSNGMKTLRMACLEHILNGVTTIDEYVRVLGLASE